MQYAFMLIIAISISLALDSNIFVAGIGIGNFFLSEPSKLLIIAFFELISLIFAFYLLLFIYFFFLLDNLFGVCKKSGIFFFKPFFVIF